MNTIDTRHTSLSLLAACNGINFSRSTYYRVKRKSKDVKRNKSPRALTIAERQSVLDVLHEPRFADLPVPQVYAHLIDEGRYLASERTMYRILSDEKEVKERRKLRRHPKYKKPELLATAPNQLWSWDITKLRGPNKLEYYHLYVIIDVFSRYVTGWMIASVESSELAKELISKTCKSQKISPDDLTIHSDRGPSMKSKTVAELLAHLGVIKSHSRPRVSNDNPYSEAHFKTLKYCATYPDRFGSMEDAKAFCRDFFGWYNTEHYHSGISMMTPQSIHFGQAENIRQKRNEALKTAYNHHKERFVMGIPNSKKLAREVWINKPNPNMAHIFVENQAVRDEKSQGGYICSAEMCF